MLSPVGSGEVDRDFQIEPMLGIGLESEITSGTVPVIFSKLKVLESTCLTILVLAKLSVLSVTPLELGNKAGMVGGVVGGAKS